MYSTIRSSNGSKVCASLAHWTLQIRRYVIKSLGTLGCFPLLRFLWRNYKTFKIASPLRKMSIKNGSYTKVHFHHIPTACVREKEHIVSNSHFWKFLSTFPLDRFLFLLQKKKRNFSPKKDQKLVQIQKLGSRPPSSLLNISPPREYLEYAAFLFLSIECCSYCAYGCAY